MDNLLFLFPSLRLSLSIRFCFFLDDPQFFSFNPQIWEGKVYLVGCKPRGKLGKAVADWVVKKSRCASGISRQWFRVAQDACTGAPEEVVDHTVYLPLAAPAFSQGNETLTWERMFWKEEDFSCSHHPQGTVPDFSASRSCIAFPNACCGLSRVGCDCQAEHGCQ